MAIQIIQPNISSLRSHHFQSLHPSNASLLSPRRLLQLTVLTGPKKYSTFSCRSSAEQDDEYLYAPESAGDGFSFSGGKYSDEPGKADDWLKQGNIVKAHTVLGSGQKAKDPIFGLTMGAGSQAAADNFRVYRLKHALYI